jgi:hypothetical protein
MGLIRDSGSADPFRACTAWQSEQEAAAAMPRVVPCPCTERAYCWKDWGKRTYWSVKSPASPWHSAQVLGSRTLCVAARGSELGRIWWVPWQVEQVGARSFPLARA